MNVIHGLNVAPEFRRGFVSIGNFDGVHRGHQAMIAVLVRNARSTNVPAVVFTFDPHPISLLRPTQSPPPLTTTERKIELLQKCGVDGVIVYPTDRELLDLSPREFFDRIIVGQLAATGLVEGPNFFFGRDRAGTIDVLREFCTTAKMKLEIVTPVTLGDRLVSSTEIRRLITTGDVGGAADLMGTPYRVHGTVVRGVERGRTIGFPTANLEYIATVLPRDGVYAGRAWHKGAAYAAGINVGPNPTFGEHQRKIEVHLIGFSSDLYGCPLDVDFLHRLRDTRPFGGIDELKAQLQQDIAQSRALAEATSPR